MNDTRKTGRWLLLALGFFLPVSFLYGQHYHVWTKLEVEKELSKSFSVQANVQARLQNGFSSLRSYLGEAGVQYSLNKRWAAGVYYRFQARHKLNKETENFFFEPRHRFFADVNYDQNLAKWLKINYRLRYQNQFRDDAVEGVSQDGSYIRNKLGLEYRNKSDFSPDIESDFFYLLGTGFDAIRLKANLGYKINKINSVKISAFRDLSLRDLIPNGPLVLAFSYSLKF